MQNVTSANSWTGYSRGRHAAGVPQRKGYCRRGLRVRTLQLGRSSGDAATARIGRTGSSELLEWPTGDSGGAADRRKRSPISDAVVSIWRGNACCGVTTGETETSAEVDSMAEG